MESGGRFAGPLIVQKLQEETLRAQFHRILSFAGLGLLAGVVIHGSPASPQAFMPVQDRGFRVADAAAGPSDILPLPVALQRHLRSSASAKPNPASCPGPESRSLLPPVSGALPAPQGSSEAATPRAAGIGGAAVAPASPCPDFGSGSDAQTDIARGHALAQPEPLNSRQLMAPARH